jgi:AraC-like DNA-binding protein
VTPTSKAFADATKHADRRRYSQIIERYLSDCYAQRTAARVTELAQLLDTATPYLSRIIPRLFGKPLRALLREKQLEEAKRLLRTTPLTCGEVALASAFGSPATFYRIFRRACGMTPEQYRRRSQVKK